MVRHLFLDLEDTVITPVIEEWATAELINVQKILNFIHDYNPDTLNIFSFALHNDFELNGFRNSGTQMMIERVFNTNLIRMPTVEYMIDIFTKHMRLGQGSVDFIDFTHMVGKQNAFRIYVKEIGRNHDEFILLDDVVFREKFSFTNASGEIFNIDGDVDD